MCFLIFEGYFEDLNERHLRFIRNVLEKRGYKNNTVIFTAVGQAGDNFASNVKRIKVIVDDDEDFSMILKFAPSSEILRSVLHPKFLFENEVVIYTELLPKFKQLEETYNVPKHARLRHAECYGYLLEEPDEMILLEDLTSSGYVMLSKLACLDTDHMKLSLRNFATFHALSYVLKTINADAYDVIRNKLVDSGAMYRGKEEFQCVISGFENDFIDMLSDQKHKKYIEGTLTNLGNMDMELLSQKVGKKSSVIQHGDVWVNNILFKMKEDEASECLLIDYQMSSESNPVCDLLNLIFNCTSSPADRNKYINECLEYYYEQLGTYLRYFGLTVAELYTRDQFYADIKTFSKAHFGQCLLAIALVTKNNKEAAAMKDAMDFSDDLRGIEESMVVSKMSAETVSLCKQKIENLISSYKVLEVTNVIVNKY